MRAVPVLLLGLLILVQASLWLGKGSVPHVMALRAELAAQAQANEQARAENARLGAEVADLKDGLEMVEEKARQELGMVKPNELLVVVSPAGAAR
jgi:cell division protein FtsB